MGFVDHLSKKYADVLRKRLGVGGIVIASLECPIFVFDLDSV